MYLFGELECCCGCPHSAAMKSVGQHSSPIFISTHDVLTTDGQSLLPGHIDQGHTDQLLTHLSDLAV